VAAKKPVKQAAKAVKKTSKPVAGSHAAPKPAGKKPVAKKSAPSKADPKKAPVTKPVAKAASKPVATKPAASKPTGSKLASKKAPAQAVAKKPAVKPSVAHKPASPTPKPVPNPVAKPVGKPVAKPLAQPAVSAGKSTIAPRPAGKVAVAVAAKPSAAPRKDKVKIVSYKTDETTGRPILPAGYKPSPDEEYMGALQVEYFRQRLQSWRADLVEESKQTIENLKDEVRDVGDEAERATRETENSLELRTRDRYRKLIGKIDSTLKRLDSGDYGYSVDSGEDIGLERLEARLTAERTIDEQERWEHLQKQIGD
jgi:DnaK suppressor protein